MCLDGLQRLRFRLSVVFAMVIVFGVGAGPMRCDEPFRENKNIQEHQAAQIAAIGTNVLIVGLPFGQATAANLTIQDADAIAKKCPAAVAVAPIARIRGDVTFNDRKWIPYGIVGTTQTYLVVRDWTKLKEGNTFSEEDVRDAKPVCLLGQTVVESLFENASPLGKKVSIKGSDFRVVGVLAKRGRDSFGADQDDVILVPWATVDRLRKTTDQGSADAIWVKAASSEKVHVAEREIAKVLRQRRHIAKPQQDNFIIVDPIKRLATPIRESKDEKDTHP
jgi:putative ABC transport system permease protein